MAFENPTLDNKAFRRIVGQPMNGPTNPYANMIGQPQYAAPANVMTANGAYQKTALLLMLAIVAASFGWTQVDVYGGQIIAGSFLAWLIPIAIISLILALVTSFKPQIAPITGPIYALGEGLLVGMISHLYEAQYGGIVLQAVAGTVCVFAVMLFLYSSHIIKVTQRYAMVVIAATFGILLMYLVAFGLSLFGVNLSFLRSGSLLGIGISLLILVVAALNLPLDFNFIERGAQAGAPKYLEWYGAFGLMVSLIWIYLTILRLLAQLQSRR